jgi:hypothetical protein
VSDYFGGPAGPPVPPPLGSPPPAPGPGYLTAPQLPVSAPGTEPAFVIPRSNATTVGAVAALAGLLMVAGAWAPWMSVSFDGIRRTASGLDDGFDGRYLLIIGIVALLLALGAVVQHASAQARQSCAALLVLLGVVGLIVVIHEWTTISAHVRQMEDLFRSLSAVANSSSSEGSTAPGVGFGALAALHIGKAWGLVLSGLACGATAAAGVALFLV